MYMYLISSDKETVSDLPSGNEAFEVEQVLSLIISYLGGEETAEIQKIYPYPPTKRVTGISKGREASQIPKLLKVILKLNWNFQRVRRVQTKKPSVGYSSEKTIYVNNIIISIAHSRLIYMYDPPCMSLVVSLGFLTILKSSFVIVTLCGWRN